MRLAASDDTPLAGLAAALCAGRWRAAGPRMAANRGGCQHGLAPPPPNSGREPQLQRGRDQGARRCAGARDASPTGPRSNAARSPRAPTASRRRSTSRASPCRCAGWWPRATTPTPSSSPATPIPACRLPRGHGAAGVRHQRGGVLTALARAERFGVIAIGQRSIRRHVRYLRQMGLTDRFAGERPLNMSVAETASGEEHARPHDRGRPRAARRGRRRRRSSWAAPAWPATARPWRPRSASP